VLRKLVAERNRNQHQQECTVGSVPSPPVVLPPVGGFELTLEVTLASIPADAASRTAIIEHFACLRAVVYGKRTQK